MNQNGAAGERLVLFAVESSYASDIAESAARAGWGEVAGVFTTPPKYQVSGVASFSPAAEVPQDLFGLPVLCCEIVPGWRKKHTGDARDLGFETFPILADPSSIVSPSAILERGCYVNALSVVASHAELGRFAMVGRSCSLGHHSRMAEFTTLGPGVTIASHCAVERGAFIGAGATVAPSVSIGANSVVGAGAMVIRDVPDNCVVVGNPAKVIRENVPGYMGIGV